MKTAISIPDRVFQAAERAAERLSMSRSELYTKAVQAFLASRRDEDVTRRLNEVYCEESSAVDSGLSEMQARSVSEESW
jgi:metal-responsive CopG/Arc/MetJ family transcriptional regulator